MYDFSRIHHSLILTHTVLIALTPLIPIPFLDDVIKTALQRRLARLITGAHGQNPSAAEIDALLDEGFAGCVGGCAYTIFVYPVRKLARKLFIILEWRRALSLVSHTYYFFFLLDAALADGYTLTSLPEEPNGQAARLRQAIATARQGANFNLISTIFRRSLRPLALLRGALALAGSALRQIPLVLKALISAPGNAFRQARQPRQPKQPGQSKQPRQPRPGFFQRMRSAFFENVRQRAGVERQPGMNAAERIAAGIADRMQVLILKLPPDHFNLLHDRLRAVLEGNRAAAQLEAGLPEANQPEAKPLAGETPLSGENP